MPMTFSAWRISSWTLPTCAPAAPSYEIWTPWQGTCASIKSLEECNKDTINASFFGIHFGHKIEEQERGGARYVLRSKQYLNNEDYALLHNLQPGLAPQSPAWQCAIFDFGEMPGPTTQPIHLACYFRISTFTLYQ